MLILSLFTWLVIEKAISLANSDCGHPRNECVQQHAGNGTRSFGQLPAKISVAQNRGLLAFREFQESRTCAKKLHGR